MKEREVISREAAKYSGKWCVTESAGDEAVIVGGLYATEEEARSAQRQLATQYPKAVVGRWPTREEWDEFHRQHEEDSRYNLSYFQAVVDYQLPNGDQVSGYPLSPHCATEETARRYLEEIRQEHPDAYLVWGTWHIHRDSPKDMSFREKMVAQMVR